MLAAGLRDLAVVRMAQGKFAESQPLLERSLVIEENYVGKQSPLLAATLVNLARVHLNQQHYGEAEQLLKRALDAQEAAGSQDQGTMAVLTTLAEVYRKTDRALEAESLDARARTMGTGSTSR
jgi:hypothetical protein